LDDRLFRALVIGSFASGTLTAKFFWGDFLSKIWFAYGALPICALLLAAAVVRAANCLKNIDSKGLNK
jgi:hypothetical protein